MLIVLSILRSYSLLIMNDVFNYDFRPLTHSEFHDSAQKSRKAKLQCCCANVEPIFVTTT